MRVLLVEDSVRLQRSLMTGLRKSGYAVDVAGDGEEGLWRAQTVEYDAIILDIMLPKLDGLQVLERLRSQGSQANVLLLTARDAVEDRVAGLRRGADDYLVKPFAFDELLARLEALIRRGFGRRNPSLQIGGLRIDTAARRAYRDEEAIDLAPREYALLELFALRPGEVIGRAEIEKSLYDERVEPMSNVVDSAVCALRRKIDPAEGPSYIQTRRGMGYALEPPVR